MDENNNQKRILITGAGSYIGESFRKYATEHYPQMRIETLNMHGDAWKEHDFSKYDSIFHVAGIAHADIGKASKADKQKYYDVNTKLAVETARKAKTEGAGQFIFMSSMLVYGDAAPVGKEKMITCETKTSPSNFYGDSKWQADKRIQKLGGAQGDKCTQKTGRSQTDRRIGELGASQFATAIIRCPMVYGPGCKGNYRKLEKLARICPIFPDIDNKRSMIHIDNLCEFICRLVLSGEGGIFFPQDPEYINTSEMYRSIRKSLGKKTVLTKLFNPVIRLAAKMPWKVGKTVNKVFGSMWYEGEIASKKSTEKTFTQKALSEPAMFRKLPCNTSMDRYSVLMSVYKNDEPEYLKQSLDSMIGQTVAPDEIVLVQDGPLTLELLDVISEYRSKYPELMHIVSLEKNSGLGAALNFGIKHVRNELIARMDADDISLKDRCELQLKAFAEDPGLAIVGTQIYEFENDPANIQLSRTVPTSYKDIIGFAKRRSPFNHPSVMYRKSAIEAEGGYKAYKRKEDLELFIRMLKDGYKAKNLNKACLLYRTDPENLKRRMNWVNCREYISIMNDFHRQGWNGTADMIYVVAGQLLMHFAPTRLVKRLNRTFLREKPQV